MFAVFFSTCLVTYHASLIARNLTTNESVNWRKYPHMRRQVAAGKFAFHNAFDGGVLRNIGWRLGLVHFDDRPVRPVPPPVTSREEPCDHDHDHGHHHHGGHRHAPDGVPEHQRLLAREV